MYCPDCGNEISDQAGFCNSCGGKLDSGEAPQAPLIPTASSKPPFNKKLLLVLVALLVAAAAGAGAYYFVYMGEKPGETVKLYYQAIGAKDCEAIIEYSSSGSVSDFSQSRTAAIEDCKTYITPIQNAAGFHELPEITIEDETVSGEKATVEFSVVAPNSNGGRDNRRTAKLLKEDGIWKIDEELFNRKDSPSATVILFMEAARDKDCEAMVATFAFELFYESGISKEALVDECKRDAGIGGEVIDYKILQESIDGDKAEVEVEATTDTDGAQSTASDTLTLNLIRGEWKISLL